MLWYNDLTDPASVRAFLSEDQLREPGSKRYFKLHEDRDEWLIVDGADSVRIRTDQETMLYFLLAYNLPKLRQDEQGYQYFEISDEIYPAAGVDDAGVLATLFLARHITTPDPKNR